MLSSIRYDFLPFDASYRLDNASSNYCGYISDITTGLVAVINSYTVRFAASYSFNSSRSTSALVLSSIHAMPTPISNDVRLCSASLSGRFGISSTADTQLELGSILKFMDTEVSASLYPSYWSEQAILSVQALSYLHHRVDSTVSLLNNFLATNDISCAVGYGSEDLLFTSPILKGTRALNYVGLSIRQLLKTWLRWSDTSLLGPSWYAITLGDNVIHSLLGVRPRLTDAITWASRIESAHNKVCYGAIVTVGDDIVRYTGLAYEVQALSVSLLVYVSAIWHANAKIE